MWSAGLRMETQKSAESFVKIFFPKTAQIENNDSCR